uniref:Uncharacterized protein n=1 Tax=Spironucleus salmonicida TaxID=348837 RepID=V6LGI5_9EUKA|eukprot:EST42796.1 Hypothetical protein SS50377_17565 [Spironucleus salmonicida]
MQALQFQSSLRRNLTSQIRLVDKENRMNQILKSYEKRFGFTIQECDESKQSPLSRQIEKKKQLLRQNSAFI